MNRAEVAGHLRGVGTLLAYEDGREFELYREVDVTGVSGTGVVADGVEFANGIVVMQWHGEHPSVAVWPSIEQVIATHGHEGKTVVRWRTS